MKNWCKQLLFKAGFEIRRTGPQTPGVVWQQLLALAKVDLILDIGANTGQTGEKLRRLGYRGRIVSFEPLESAYAQLLNRANGDSEWTVAERMAIGAEDGEITINRSANSQSSSILPMLRRHQVNAEESRYIGKEKVQIRRLETAAAEPSRQARSVMLKIDTQGYEESVLQGVGLIWPKVTLLEVELTVVPLYEGQILWLEMIHLLEDRGYTLILLEPVFSEQKTGRVLQYDGLFLLSNLN